MQALIFVRKKNIARGYMGDERGRRAAITTQIMKKSI
jgi:hypothetical protein